MGAVITSETSVNFYDNRRRNIQKTDVLAFPAMTTQTLSAQAIILSQNLQWPNNLITAVPNILTLWSLNKNQSPFTTDGQSVSPSILA
jgi:hypothetical protein